MPNKVRVAHRVMTLAERKDVVERAIATCTLLGVEVERASSSSYIIRGDARSNSGHHKYFTWMRPERCFIAYCLVEGLDIET